MFIKNCCSRIPEASMKLFFYPYDYKYKIKDDKVLVHLYSQLSDGRRACIVVQHEPYFYASLGDRKLDEERLKAITVPLNSQTGRITRWEEVEKEFQGKQQKFLRAYTNIPM